MLESPVFFLLLLCGTSFFVAGLIVMKFPPKKINSLYGYRTSRSMRNQQSWDLAQQYSSRQMVLIGTILVSLSFLSSLLAISAVAGLIAGFSVFTALIIVFMLRVENVLKRNERG